MKRLFVAPRSLASLMGGLLLTAGIGVAAQAQIAMEDFDGNAVNLITSSVPALDGGGGDYFGVGSRNAWPQDGTGVPFGIGDDSASNYSSEDSLFETDDEGIFGQNSDFDNNFFAISDSDEFEAEQVASWTFDISGATGLSVSIDMGGISNDSFGGFNLEETDVVFTAQIDGGATQTLFDLDAVENTSGFVTRPMDSGIASGGGALLVVSGDNAVTKILADTGAAADNLFLDKTPADGAGAGMMDTFSTALNGTGSELTIALTANFPFEAMAFDNIQVNGVPEPSSVSLLSLGLLCLFRRRRS